MMRPLVLSVALATMLLCSCGKKEPEPSSAGQRATVVLKDGTQASGTVVASSNTEITIAGDDNIKRTIPMTQVRSVEYGDTAAAAAAAPAPAPAASGSPAPAEPAPRAATSKPPRREFAQRAPAAAAPERRSEASAPPQVTTRTYVVPAGAELAVRTDETIDSATASEGQTFSAGVTKDVRDANGDVVIPRGSRAQIVIKSATKGGRFRGTSDLVLDMQSVSIGGRTYRVETADISEHGKAGLGANKRTATYTGGGAALGAIIGAIAGGGKGAAIGAASGAGAGAITQTVTKGRSIKVPAESVLTFKLDNPLSVRAE
jgi:hypothetical protein